MHNNAVPINMSALADKPIQTIRPLELALIGKGFEKISLKDITAEIVKLHEEGYLRGENIDTEDGRFILIKKPDDNLPVYAKILLNGLFYKTDEIKSINIPLIFSYVVHESIAWLQFENRKSLKDARKTYQKHISEFKNGDNLCFICVLGQDKKYAKNHPDVDFSIFSDVYKCLSAILTPNLSPIGRAIVGGVGRGIAGTTGMLSANTDVKNINNIDWNYLLYRNENM